MTSETAKLLKDLAAKYETTEFLNGDPSWYMHQVKGDENQETLAFIASCLSYGSRKQFMPKIGQLLEWSGGETHKWVKEGGFNEHLCCDDKGCFYRLYNCSCMHSFLTAYREMLLQFRTMGEYVRHNATDTLSAIEAICHWFSTHGSQGVVPKDTTSACKRVCMFLRWMVRDNSPVDLGLWANFIDKRTLIMPLDTHVLTESKRLGLTASRTASMTAAIKLTDTLATVFPDDPLKGDFALFGYGVNIQ